LSTENIRPRKYSLKLLARSSEEFKKKSIKQTPEVYSGLDIRGTRVADEYTSDLHIITVDI
jgi:hypothetical protein